MDEEIELEKNKFQARAKLEKSTKTSLQDSENSKSAGENYRTLRYHSFKESFLTGQGFEINSKLKRQSQAYSSSKVSLPEGVTGTQCPRIRQPTPLHNRRV